MAEPSAPTKATESATIHGPTSATPDTDDSPSEPEPEPIEPVVGQVAQVERFVVKVSEGSRPNLPPQYAIYTDHGALQTMSVSGWQGSLAWVAGQVGKEVDDLKVQIVKPASRSEPPRHDQLAERSPRFPAGRSTGRLRPH